MEPHAPTADDACERGAFNSTGDPKDFAAWYEGLPEETLRYYDQEAKVDPARYALILAEHSRRRAGGVPEDTEASRIYDTYNAT